MILRYRLLGIEQYVVDPEREYEKLAKNLNGSIIKIGPTSQTYINILDIRKESIEEEEYITKYCQDKNIILEKTTINNYQENAHHD